MSERVDDGSFLWKTEASRVGSSPGHILAEFPAPGLGPRDKLGSAASASFPASPGDTLKVSYALVPPHSFPDETCCSRPGSGQMHGRGHRSLCPPARTCSKYVSVIPAQPAELGWGDYRQGGDPARTRVLQPPTGLPVPKLHMLPQGSSRQKGAGVWKHTGSPRGPQHSEGAERKQPQRTLG